MDDRDPSGSLKRARVHEKAPRDFFPSVEGRASEPPSETASGNAGEPPFAIFLGRLRLLWPWLVLAALTWLGWHEVRQVDVIAVRRLMRETDPGVLLALLGATVLNLAVFGLYDVVALGPRSRPPSTAARWNTGVLSFAWSNFLTVGPLAGPALRLWLYRPLHVDREKARSALAAILVSFSLGLASWCGGVAVPLPAPLDSLPMRIALAGALAAACAIALSACRRLPLVPPLLRRWDGNAWAMMGIALADWLVAWWVFHVALLQLQGGIDLRLSMRAFFIGQLVGLISFIPGGLGSADAYWLIALSAAAGGRDRALAAILLYRCVYYLLPWLFASLILAGRLVRAGRKTSAILRSVLASYSFLCGALLIASAATPGLADRVAFLRRSVPLGLVEVSHGLSVVLGFLLLVISRGLARGYRSTHRLALALFLAGALTTFLKGLDFEEAILSLGAAGVLLIFHRSFLRAGRMRPPVEFVVSVGVFAITLFAAIGFGSLSSPPESVWAFSHFGYFAHGARFLRALLLLISLSAVVALNFALRARPQDRLPGTAEIDAALSDVERFARTTHPLLVAGADKCIFRAGIRVEGFIAYRTSGRFLIAYSDPVCPQGSERDLLAEFLEQAASQDRDVILYQISAGFLPVAHDFGFNFFKLGEEAIVDLPVFDMRGSKAKGWRHACNSVEKAGCRFEIVQGEDLRPILGELREISDEWLGAKHVGEMRFSVGRFDEAYLMRFPCALVREGSGRIVGFANVLEGPAEAELSVDLMRYRGDERDAVRGVMDYLFLKLMLHGRERGFRRFNLGMAPLSSVGEQPWAHTFERLARLLFLHGTRWYGYEGLRRFKEKFDPVWVPRYMAYPRPWDWPFATASAALLIAGGWRGLLSPRGESA